MTPILDDLVEAMRGPEITMSDEMMHKLKSEQDALKAEVERLQAYSDEMALKFCEMRDGKNAERERSEKLREALGEALETIRHYSCAGCQPEAKGVFCFQYRSCKDGARIALLAAKQDGGNG